MLGFVGNPPTDLDLNFQKTKESLSRGPLCREMLLEVELLRQVEQLHQNKRSLIHGLLNIVT